MLGVLKQSVNFVSIRTVKENGFATIAGMNGIVASVINLNVYVRRKKNEYAKSSGLVCQ